jgi:hypothetical protein
MNHVDQSTEEAFGKVGPKYPIKLDGVAGEFLHFRSGKILFVPDHTRLVKWLTTLRAARKPRRTRKGRLWKLRRGTPSGRPDGTRGRRHWPSCAPRSRRGECREVRTSTTGSWRRAVSAGSERNAMCDDQNERLARALFRAFDEHVIVPPKLEARLLTYMRMLVREIDDDLPKMDRKPTK